MTEALKSWESAEQDLAVTEILGSLTLDVLSPEETVNQSSALEDVLAAHVNKEEEPGGFFEELVELFPGQAPAVSELKREHVTLLEKARALSFAVSASLEALKRCRDLRDEFAESLSAHQQAELTILQTAVLQDTGGGGD